MSCVIAHFTDIQTARQVDRQVKQLCMYVCVGLKVVELLNLLLEAALVLIKFNTRWHNSIKPPRTTTSVAAETSERQHLFSSYQVNIEPP